MKSDVAMGWLQFGGGVAALFLQIWGALHGVQIDPSHAAVATGVAAGGYATAKQGGKIN